MGGVLRCANEGAATAEMDAATSNMREIDIGQRFREERQGLHEAAADDADDSRGPLPGSVAYGFDTTTGRRLSWACSRSKSAACARTNSAFLAREGIGGAALGSAMKRSAAAIAMPATK